MFNLTHFVGLLTYAAAGLAVAFALPDLVPPALLTTPQTAAWMVGALVFLVGALAHEALARRAAFLTMAGRVLSLGDGVTRLREEVRQLRDVQRVQAAAIEGASEVDAVLDEMRRLKAQVDQLAARRETAIAGGADYDDQPRVSRPNLSDERVLREVVRDALGADRMDIYLQPIVTLPQRRLQFFECSPWLRTLDGTQIPPSRYLATAQELGLMATLDNAVLFRAVHLVRRMRRRQQPLVFFCNISGTTINDRTFFADFIGFMRDNADLASTLVFQITQYDLYHLKAGRDNELAGLTDLGFRFSIDKITNLDLFVSDLSAKGFRYAKIEAPTLLAKLDRAGDPRALKRSLDRGAIDLIVSGIDTDAQLLEMLDYAIDFGQGLLFGEPRPAD